VFAVQAARPLLEGPGTLVGVNAGAITLHARRPGRFLLRMHYSPYWQLPPRAGCIAPTPSGWTELRLRQPGTLRLTSDFGLDQLADRNGSCS
jgi:hypothetical protein